MLPRLRFCFAVLVLGLSGRTALAQGTGAATAAAAQGPAAAPATSKGEKADRAVNLQVREAHAETEQKESAAREAEKTAEQAADQKASLRTEIETARSDLTTAQHKAKQLEVALDTAQSAFQHRFDANAPQDELRPLQERVRAAQEAVRNQRDEVHDLTERLDGMQTDLLGLQAQEHDAAAKADQERWAALFAKWHEWLIAAEQTTLWQGPKVVLILVLMFVLRWMSRV